MPNENDTTNVGVIGVGSMGQHHVRVYSELPGADLVGITDVDEARAKRIAEEYGTAALERDELVDRADAVSVAVPTEYHYPVVSQVVEEGVDVLVEKPFVQHPERGRDLIERAAANDAIIQVGHVERFNPAVNTVSDIVADLDIISIRTRRLGPPPGRDIQDSVIFDLMIHDLDVILSLLDEEPLTMRAVETRENDHAIAVLEFPSDVIGTLVTSRVTQQKVRQLEITAETCFVVVDYLEQSIKIHRHSTPEFIEQQGDMRYQHQGLIERPMVDNGEPLKRELSTFVETVAGRHEPMVSAEQGLRAVEYARRLDSLASGDSSDHDSMELKLSQ